MAGFLIFHLFLTAYGTDDQEADSIDASEVALNVSGAYPPSLVIIKGGRDLYERDETKTSNFEATNRPTSRAHSRVFSNWQTAQTATFDADDNNRIDRDHLVTAASPPNGGGVGVGAAEYAGLDFEDDDTPILVLDPERIHSFPEGSSATFKVNLSEAPSGDVTVRLRLDDRRSGEADIVDSDLTIDPPTLTFTTTNWNSPQKVTVTHRDNNTVETSGWIYIRLTPSLNSHTR